MPSELEPVAAVLRANRVSPEQPELHRLKRRVLARAASRLGTQWSFRRHLVTVLTVVGLVGGSGGALAVAGGSGGSSAAAAQYCKDKKHHKCEKGEKTKKQRKDLAKDCKKDKAADSDACKDEESEHDHGKARDHSAHWMCSHSIPLSVTLCPCSIPA